MDDIIEAVKATVADPADRRRIYWAAFTALLEHGWEDVEASMGVDDAFDQVACDRLPEWDLEAAAVEWCS